MDFHKKYLKYKSKYMQLKMNQTGGAITSENTGNQHVLDFVREIQGKIQGLKVEAKTYTDTENQKQIHIVKIILDDHAEEDKPSLFVVAGLSHNSFMKTSNIILDGIGKLKTKFKELYLVQTSSFKDDQGEACLERDKIKGLGGKYEDVYKPELDMNQRIANFLNNIITEELHLENVHLLGKCNGGWVVTLLLMLNNIYKGLYLAVPGIPFNVTILNHLDERRLKEINFVFGFVKQDEYLFNWGVQSCMEYGRYDETMKSLSRTHEIKYKIRMYDNGNDPHKDMYHEIDPRMIDDIIESLE